MKGGDLYKPKKRNTTDIKRRTPKRAKDERRYKDQAKEFFEEAVKNKTNKCFFCDEWVNYYEGLHHLRGRVGDYLLDREWWTIVHNTCHTELYHQSSYEQRSRQKWYKGFLARLKLKSEELYRKELRKAEKVTPLNPQLNFKEDDDE